MHDSKLSACGAPLSGTAEARACLESLSLLEATYSLEIQMHRLLIERERRLLARPANRSGDFVIRHRRAA